MADGGSTEEPPRKRARKETRKVRLLFKAPGRKSCEVWVYDFWLSSFEFFEAKLERWTSDGQEVEPIVLDLPAECQPEKGARIFRKRLFAAEFEEEETWDSVQWWRAVSGDEETLFVALWVFDLIVMKEYCSEVAETLRIFRVDCSNQFGPLASKYSDNILCVQSDPLPSKEAGPISTEAWKGLAKQFLKGQEAAKQLMDRAIASENVDPTVLRHALMAVYMSQQSEVSAWAWRHLAKVLVRQIPQSKLCLDKFLSLWKRELPSKSLEKSFLAFILDTLHLLLKESGRRPMSETRKGEILAAIESVMKIGMGGTKETDALLGFPLAFKAQISLPVFAIAGKKAQKSMLTALGVHAGEFVRGHVRFVHPELREIVLPHLEDLSIADKQFLTTASF